MSIQNGRAVKQSASLKLSLLVCLQIKPELGSQQSDEAVSNSGQPASSLQAVPCGADVTAPVTLPVPSSTIHMAAQVTISVAVECASVLMWLCGLWLCGSAALLRERSGPQHVPTQPWLLCIEDYATPLAAILT